MPDFQPLSILLLISVFTAGNSSKLQLYEERLININNRGSN